MPMSASSGTESARRRRSRSAAKAKPQATGLLGFVRSNLFGRGLLVIIVLVTAAYVWQVWSSVELASKQLGPVALGMSEDQVRAALAPSETAGGTVQDLLFDQQGRQFAVHLDGPDRRVTGISCHEQDVTSPACPALLGVRIGDPQAAVLGKLGAGQLHQTGQHQNWAYPQIGASLAMQGGQVATITLGAARDPGPHWRVWLWHLVP